jgi:DedD protein
MDSRVKERLTGAAILVAALVILIPEIFSGRRAGEKPRDVPPAAPASEGPPLRTYTAEIDSRAAPATVAPKPAESAPPPAPPSPSSPAAAPAATPSLQASAPAEPAAAAPAAPAAGGTGWFVQIGSFAQAANAQRVAQALRDKGFAVIVLPPAGSKALLRVRVGPARDRDAALQLQQRLAVEGQKGALIAP